MGLRLVLVGVACGALAVLGIRDIATGAVSVGIAGVLLAIANVVLLTR